VTDTATGTCAGQYDHQFILGQTTSLPIPAGIPTLTEYSFELFFKSDDPSSAGLEVIMGLTPVKLRKVSGTPNLQINYGSGASTLNYCDCPTDIQTDVWHHFAMSLDEISGELKCYFDGVSYDIGSNPSSVISSGIVPITDVTIGYTSDPQGLETYFSGFVKEFKWWNEVRTDFEIKHFRWQQITLGDPRILVSYSMDEANTDFLYSDRGPYAESYTVNPMWTMTSQSYFAPFTINFCEAEFYSFYNPLYLMYECLPCSADCFECDGPDTDDCISCQPNYVLLENKQ
jgi:hypothetical protein